MRAHLGGAALLAAMLLTLPSGATAQSRGVELGIDAGAAIGLSGGTSYAVGVPIQDFRLGIFVGKAVSIEPRLALSYIGGDGDDLVAISTQIGPVIPFSPERTRAQGYLRPFAGLGYADLGGGSDTQVALGMGLGVKVPLAERLAARLEGSYTHTAESFTGTHALGISAGLSFFTR
ncbi:MAG TPA: outer membrane beta-barrel protein [Gemmatimonadales bacterium]|nr:outer membrane beta-barrel protein [Gemmatimonadales bacterium]